ncbi:hypothetical protein MIND_00410600 [Mycena indigotica]|uniref:Uncharacterized protein n=1 Tax=Mycena indigotica TaxID=2126181 RepID=A0A8H6SVF3_9AGAR|nr:uncharacterized protein MIND_00410600 [Mycena indigotica]KAF7306201.1 hypothetical protein MIND_00410600 [Mycena indigotica]
MDEIPDELVELIAHSSTPHDTACLCLANKRLATICRRSLYHTIEIDISDAARTVSLMTTLAEAPRCVRLVRRLDITSIKSVDPNALGKNDSFGTAETSPNLKETFKLPLSWLFPPSCSLVSDLAPFRTPPQFTLQFLERHQATLQALAISDTVGTHILLAYNAEENSKIPQLTFPCLTRFAGPSALAENWLLHSPIEHLVIPCFAVPDGMVRDVLHVINAANLTSCAFFVDGWDAASAPFAALAAHAPGINMLTVFTNGDGGVEAYEAFLLSIDPFLAQLTSLSTLQLPSSGRHAVETNQLADSEGTTSEITHLRRWAKCCPTLIYVRLSKYWSWAAHMGTWLNPDKIDGTWRIGTDSEVGKHKSNSESDDERDVAGDATWHKRLQEVEAVMGHTLSLVSCTLL